MDSNNISTTVNLLLAGGALIAGTGYAWGQFFSGKNKQTKETNDNGLGTIGYLNAQIDSMQKIADQQSSEIKALTSRLDVMSGQLKEKDKQITEYTEIFKGRDPQILQVLQSLQEYEKKNSENWNQMVALMKDIKTALDK